MLARIVARLERVLAPPRATYVPLIVDNDIVGWLTPQRAQRLGTLPSVFRVSADRVELVARLDTPAARTEALAEVSLALATEGVLTAWRNERYAVAARRGDRPLFELERAAARYFGVHTYAAHLNGTVGEPGDWRMWLARRSRSKGIDPGLLDNLVGGGLAAGASIAVTVVKEAWEEAGIVPELAQGVLPAGIVQICRDQADGLHRETIYVHDLWLQQEFTPVNQDGEAVEHRLCIPDEVLKIIVGDDITADASLVIVDFLIRHGHVPPDDPSFMALDGLRHAPRLARGG